MQETTSEKTSATGTASDAGAVMYSNIVVGYDASDYSKAALIEAANRVRKNGGKVTLVHAVFFDEEEFGIAPVQHEKRLELGHKLCFQQKEKFSSEFGIEMESLVCEGEPPEVVAEVAQGKGADLIALGTHGRKGIKRLLLGSVTSVPACYIRPIAFRGYGVMGLDPIEAPVNVTIACWPWETYMGEEALREGVDVGVSSWRQRGINSMPPAIKATGNYLNSSFARIEANQHGYNEAVLLNEDGKVTEGTGENLFIVRDGVISPPPTSDGLLEGITRDSIMILADDLGYPVLEESLVRTDLYTADEMFMTGSAAEVVPVRSVDHRIIGPAGPITLDLQQTFFKVVHGEVAAYEEWLERV